MKCERLMFRFLALQSACVGVYLWAVGMGLADVREWIILVHRPPPQEAGPLETGQQAKANYKAVSKDSLTAIRLSFKREQVP